MKAIDFLELVHEELNNLKENATQEEIDNLDFNTLNPMSVSDCIYGQMTGGCRTKRALSLYPKMFHNIPPIQETYKNWVISDNSIRTNGVTPLEVYITLKGAKNKEVIQYLKGEIDEITL